MAPFHSQHPECRIAFFISPHGFGHAARAAGVMSALREINPSIRFEIFTKVPRWFFEESLEKPFVVHSLLTDIGLVQVTPLREDLSRTLHSLNAFLPFNRPQIINLAKKIRKKECQLVLCDIAPMGIVVAKEAGIPSVLIENFTWDWIYEGYERWAPSINDHITYLKGVFQSANYHIQAEPICNQGHADLTTYPVSRKCRTSARETRSRLGLPKECKLAMITMGGTPQHFTSLEQLANRPDVLFVIRVGKKPLQLRDNVLLLPYRSDFFHPDLINACDAVIGKVGYSTLAEIYHAGIPFGYVTRPQFRESRILVDYIQDNMNGFAISESRFQEGAWLPQLSDLLSLPRLRRRGPNGAEQIAQFVDTLLK
jgi:UDP:flavonoid glycosyltransferase YjiC (YdhE family)